MNNTIRIRQGDSRIFPIPVKLNGVPYNLTGHKAIITVKKNTSQTDSAAIIQKIFQEIPNPELGVILFDVRRADSNNAPGEYVWDVQITNPSTNHEETVLFDDFIILPQATRTSLLNTP
jgi:hypothetical protein